MTCRIKVKKQQIVIKQRLAQQPTEAVSGPVEDVTEQETPKQAKKSKKR